MDSKVEALVKAAEEVIRFYDQDTESWFDLRTALANLKAEQERISNEEGRSKTSGVRETAQNTTQDRLESISQRCDTASEVPEMIANLKGEQTERWCVCGHHEDRHCGDEGVCTTRTQVDKRGLNEWIACPCAMFLPATPKPAPEPQEPICVCGHTQNQHPAGECNQCVSCHWTERATEPSPERVGLTPLQSLFGMYPHEVVLKSEAGSLIQSLRERVEELEKSNEAWDIHCAELLEENTKLRKLVKNG